MTPDPIIDEIRRIRDENAKRHNYDAESMGREFIENQNRSNHPVVDLRSLNVTKNRAASSQATLPASTLPA